MRVLLADAGTLSGGTFDQWAASAGHDVTSCADADAVRAAFSDHSPRLLVLDWGLPGDALDLLGWLRVREGGGAPDVLLLVPGDVEGALERALESGADDVLLHPMREDEFALRLGMAERRVADRERAWDEHRALMDLLEQAPDLIQTVAPDGRLLFVNRAWCDALGYTERESFQLSFFDLVAPDQRAQVRKAFRWVLRGRGVRHLQTELRACDGTAMSVEGNLTPRYRGKTPTSVRVILRDISRRKRAETVLRNVLEGTSATTGKDFFRSLVRHLSRALDVRHALVAELRPGDDAHMQTLAVWSGNDFRENRAFDVVAMPAAGVLQGMAGAAIAGEASLFPGARFLAELEAASYLGVPLTNAAGESIGLLCVLHDGPMPTGPDALRILTTFAQRAGAELERLRVEQRLANNEARMRAMLDAMPDLLFRIDVDGRYLSVHTHDPDMLFIEADQLLGRTVSEVLPADLAAAIMTKLEAALETNVVQVLEYDLPVPSGGQQFEARMVSCGPSEVLAVVRDVTARVRAEAERRDLDRRMQQSQKLESLGVLAGGIAHDFNNLLTSIMGYSSLAQRSASPGSPTHRYLADIEKASRRAADLAMQMLAYSGKGQFVVQPLDLRDVIRETTGLLKTDLLGRSVHLRVDLPRTAPAMEGDVTQVRQILMNLLLNAAQAMEPDGGSVTISLRERAVRRAEFAGCYVGPDLTPGTYLVLSIADAGCGMDAGTVARIFDPFFTTKTGGRGLGLAAAVGIVRGHRGALSVQSARGEGTTVTVYFPPSEKSARADSVPPRARAHPRRGADPRRGRRARLAAPHDEHPGSGRLPGHHRQERARRRRPVPRARRGDRRRPPRHDHAGDGGRGGLR